MAQYLAVKCSEVQQREGTSLMSQVSSRMQVRAQRIPAHEQQEHRGEGDSEAQRQQVEHARHQDDLEPLLLVIPARTPARQPVNSTLFWPTSADAFQHATKTQAGFAHSLKGSSTCKRTLADNAVGATGGTAVAPTAAVAALC